MELLVLGIFFGSLTIVMPGPISVSLVQVATAQGRSSGVRAAFGIAGGDVVLGAAAIAVVSLGAALPDRIFSAVQLGTAGVLLIFGLFLLARPAAVEKTAADVTHPLRSFLLVTVLMPTAFGAWIATLSAMPFATDRRSLTCFAIGMLAVSLIWHPLVGVSAGAIGPRLTPRVLRIGTRVGGVATMGLGLWSLISS